MSCGEMYGSLQDTSKFKTIIHDDCEYLILKSATRGRRGGYGFMAHKGNCKFCAMRRATK